MALKNIKWPKLSGDGDLNDPTYPSDNGKIKWRTIVGLFMIYGSVLLNWQWVWGVLTLYWIIPDLFTGVTYFIEPISRRNHPILYWLILTTWVAFSVVILFSNVSA